VLDPEGPATGSSRVIRGGGWYYDAGSCRSAHRNGTDPNEGVRDFGFRVVLAAGQPRVAGGSTPLRYISLAAVSWPDSRKTFPRLKYASGKCGGSNSAFRYACPALA